ncbi:MAG: ATP-binding protein, partial [Campylobacterales bacterium]|nr:ATP-binding protein [Campylobacterales bacterium]
IAHQWRQPLSSIGALASQVKLMSDMKKLEETSVKDLMVQVIDSTKYLSNTIEDFKNFFKPDKKIEEIEISLVVDEVLQFLDHLISIHSIQIIKEEDRKIKAKIVKNETIQVLMNLIKNAIDQLCKIEKERVIQIKVYEEMKQIHIEIADNGGGISHENLSNIFDEYFSTKSDGTGLGLYMSKMIVNNSLKGDLIAFNRDDGAVFKISF